MKPPPTRPLLLALLLTLLLPPAFSSTATAAPPPPMFASGRPVFDPVKFYTGHTRSWGVFENGRGEPTSIITTETWGRVVSGELHMEQDLWIGGKPRQHRSWKVRRLDARHFAGTANDVVGTVHGEVTGNAFFWTFTLATKPGQPLYNVQMTQHMYLQPDGRTMINRDTVRKFGVVVAGVTEEFRRLD